MSQSEAPAADWYQDPSGRFQFRYWDGESWTGHVSTDGDTEWDPPADGSAEEDTQAESAAAGQTDLTTDAPGADDSAGAPAEADSQWAAEEEAADDADAQPASQAEASQTGEPHGGTIEDGEPSDANLVANKRAGLDDDVEEWLNEVASQVEPRLSRIQDDWTEQAQAEAARACAYGLLVGHLAHLHPHMRPELSQVAEAHPSFTTLEAGARLDTLEQIAGDAQRSAAWLGPLIGNEDPEQVRMLFD